MAALNSPAGVAVTARFLTLADTGNHTIRVAEAIDVGVTGIDPITGEGRHRFRPTAPCNLFGAATIDWALPALFLGLLLGRRRLGTLFVRLRSAAAQPARSR